MVTQTSLDDWRKGRRVGFLILTLQQFNNQLGDCMHKLIEELPEIVSVIKRLLLFIGLASLSITIWYVIIINIWR